MTKTRNHSLIIAIIATILAVSLLCTVCFIVQDKVQTADKTYAASYTAECITADGTIQDHPDKNEHYTQADLQAKASAAGKRFVWIDTDQKLYDFIYNNDNTYGALAGDRTLDWASHKVHGGDNSSGAGLNANAIFDGNGYKVSIKAGVGQGTYTDASRFRSNNINLMPVPDMDELGNSNNNNAPMRIKFTGYFFADVYGKIQNTIFDFDSTHAVATSKTANDSTSLFAPGEDVSVAGIVAGAVIGGSINNCRLNINGTFVHSRQGTGGLRHSYYQENGVITGGLVGLATNGAHINAVTVNLNAGSTICSHTTGCTTGANSTRAGVAVTGGIVGNYAPVGGTKITHATLLGAGTVESYVGHASSNDGFQAFAGGLLGASMYFTDWNYWRNYIIGQSQYTKYSNTVNDGNAEIRAVMTSWKGYVMHNNDIDWDYRREKTEYSTLFGCVGGDNASSDGIKGVVVLYDYIGFRAEHGMPLENQDALDVEHNDGHYNNTARIKLSNVAIQVYPLTDGGKVYVGFDNRQGSSYDIRIQAIADKFDATAQGGMDQDIGSAPYKLLTYGDNEYGYSIWSLDIKSSSADKQEINPTQCVAGDIRLVNAEEYGSFIYKFGEVLDYELKSNNLGANKVYDGLAINDPTLVLKGNSGNIIPAKNDGTSQNLPSHNFELKLAESSSVIGDHSKAKLPGSYVFESVYQFGNTKLAYYDQAGRKIARYNSERKDVYAIKEAVFNVAGNTTSWTKQATLNMSIGKEEEKKFQAIRYSKAGEWSDYIYTTGTNNYRHVISDTTSANGDVFTFEAYCTDRDEQNREILVKVAETTVPITLKIDNVAPVIRNIKYYKETAKDSNTWEQITEEQATADWVTSAIKVTYEYSDEGRSGLATTIGQTGEQVEKIDPLTQEKYWECELVMKTGATYNISCTDIVGNTVSKSIKVSIDNINPNLTVELGSLIQDNFYPGEGGISCYFEPLPLSINATIGGSGYELWMSIAQDESKKDIWQKVDANLEDTTMEINQDINQPFVKFKLRNVAKLYGDEEGWLPVVVVPLEYGDDFIVKLAIADVYLTLDNIIYTGDILDDSGASLNGKTFAQLKSMNMLNKVLSKQYDNKAQNVIGDIDIKLFDDAGKYVADTGAIQMYNTKKMEPQYYPKSSYFELVIDYTNLNAGDTTAAFAVRGKSVQNGSDYSKLYPVFLADSVAHDEHGMLDVSQGKDTIINQRPSEIVNTTITPYSMEINVGTYLSGSYTYGDDIPSTFEVKMPFDDSVIVFDITGGLKTKCNVGTYNVGATAQVLNPNYTFNMVERSGVEVKAKEVYATPYLDGNINFNPSREFDGVAHTLTADMLNVDGVKTDVTVEFYKDAGRTDTQIYKDPATNEPLKSITNVGYYYVKFIINGDDAKNYILLNEHEYEIRIMKAFIPLELGTREEEYTGNETPYKYTVGLVDGTNLYKPEDFKLTYYPYPSNAVYDPVTKKMISGKPLSTPIANTEVKNVGFYAVTVEFNGNNTNPNFYQQTYTDCLLVINKANVNISADNITVVYDGSGHIYNHTDAGTKLMSTTFETEITEEGILDKISINKRDFQTGTYVPVDPAEDAVTNVGTYSYRLIFDETDNYKATYKDVTLTIKKAMFSGVIFDSKTVDYNPKGSVTFSAKYDPASLPEGTKVSYVYGGRKQDTPFVFTEAQTYSVDVVLERENYETLTLNALLVINPIDIVGIQADATQNTVTYDGKPHTAKVFGIGWRQDPDGTYYYNDIKASVTTNNVTYTDAGEYNGSYVIIVQNYKMLTVNTKLVIEQVQLAENDLDYSQIVNMPKFTINEDFRNVKGSFKDVNGNVVEKGFRYYLVGDDGSEQEVGLTENGTLVAGKYRAYVNCGKNYKANSYVEFTIIDPNATGGGNSSATQTGGNNTTTFIIIGSVGGGIVVIGIVVGVIIALKKKKNSAI